MMKTSDRAISTTVAIANPIDKQFVVQFILSVDRKQSTTVSSLLPLTVILLLFCLVAAKSDQSDCVEVICPLEEGGTALRLVDNADLGEGKKCEHCEQCTRNGYSVCVQPVQLNSSAPNPPTLSGCECAHSGPNVRLEDAKVAKSSAHKNPLRSLLCLGDWMDFIQSPYQPFTIVPIAILMAADIALIVPVVAVATTCHE
uniref:Uncharacterized protein n=1 Tax=Globodera rostochiensis TaxID=31243 RepID=A0A914HQ59_GLORO